MAPLTSKRSLSIVESNLNSFNYYVSTNCEAACVDFETELQNCVNSYATNPEYCLCTVNTNTSDDFNGLDCKRCVGSDRALNQAQVNSANAYFDAYVSTCAADYGRSISIHGNPTTTTNGGYISTTETSQANPTSLHPSTTTPPLPSTSTGSSSSSSDSSGSSSALKYIIPGAIGGTLLILLLLLLIRCCSGKFHPTPTPPTPQTRPPSASPALERPLAVAVRNSGVGQGVLTTLRPEDRFNPNVHDGRFERLQQARVGEPVRYDSVRFTGGRKVEQASAVWWPQAQMGFR